jgi:hypothetical protein
MAEASATAEGDLGRTPLAHLLVYAMEKRLDGVLFLSPPEGDKHTVRLARGAPVKVRPGDRFSLLGGMLVEAGHINQATLEAALATKGLLGDLLVFAGRIEPDKLEAVVDQQFLRRMVRLFDLPRETTYAYFEGHEELAEWGGDPACVDPLALIWIGLRAHAPRSALMDSTLAMLGDKPLRLHEAATLLRFGLDDPEAKLAEHLGTEAATLTELTALDLAPAEAVRRFVYALLITRQVDLGAATMPVGAVDSGRGAAVGSTVAAVARMALKSQVHRVGAAAPDLPGDGERGVVVATSRISTRKLRDRVEGPPDSSVTSTAPVSDERSSGPEEAPPTTRSSSSEPEPQVRESGVVPVPAAPDLYADRSAAELLALARERLAARDPKGATAAAEAARREAPEDADVLAFSIWARFQADPGAAKGLTFELDELLAAQAGHVQAHYYRAMLRKRLSDQAGAMRELEKVLELSPDHADAARELAALAARSAAPAARERPSLFGRLFKR